MGSATSIVINDDVQGAGRKEASEWLFFIRNALKDGILRQRMKDFLETGPTLSTDEKSCIRMFVGLEVWSKLIRRAKILCEIHKPGERKEMTESIRAEMSSAVMTIINMYVVTDAPFPIPLPRELRNMFGKLSISLSASSSSVASSSSSTASTAAASPSDAFIGCMHLGEMESLINETELNLLPSCKDLLNRFMNDPTNASFLQEALVIPIPKEIFTPPPSLSAPAVVDGASSTSERIQSTPAPTPIGVWGGSVGSGVGAAGGGAAGGVGGGGARDSQTRVLIVDDSYPMLKMLSFSLSKQGLEVVAVQNGEMALELLKQKTFHAVLIDLQMPNINGYDLAYMYRKYELGMAVSSAKSAITGGMQDDFIPYVQSITFGDQEKMATKKRLLLIGMSSSMSEVVENKVRESGMDYFIEKPFTAGTVIDLISRDNVEWGK